MQTSPNAIEVRGMVRRIFEDLGVQSRTLRDLSESILLDEGRIRARSYRADEFMAMWMVDIGLLQVYDGEGNMLHRANLLAELAPRRMAA